MTQSTPGPSAPIVQSLAASSVTASAATLNSYVNANGLATTIYFQYGLTSGYGSTTLSGNIGTGVGYFATPASGLTANTAYHFRIVASNSSGTSCGNDMTFTTGQNTAQVSAALSTLAVSPSSALADGQSTITATVTLRNGSSNPVAGKTVRLQSVAGVTISQPANPTDANGRATATITATAPVSASLCAIDTTDSVIVTQQPTVQFTTSFAPPSTGLGDAIVQLCNSSSNLLTHSIAGMAVDEGGYGDYFQAQISSDKRAQGVTALSAGIDSIITLLAPESKSVVLEVAKAIGPDLGLTGLSAGLDKIVGSSSGLAQFGQTVVGNNASWRQAEFNAKQQLMSGVLPVTANYATAYANDIGLRIQANTALKEIVLSQHNLLLDLQQNAEVAHVDLLTWLFADLNVVPTVAGTIVGTPAGGKAASTLLGLAESLDTYAVNQCNLNSDQQAYNTAVVSLIDCDHVSRLIDANTESAFNAISQGQPPSPVTGTIVNVDSEKTYVPLSGITGDLLTWGGLLFANTKYVKVTGAYTVVTVQNTSQRAAAFSVHASYWHTVTISSLLKKGCF